MQICVLISENNSMTQGVYFTTRWMEKILLVLQTIWLDLHHRHLLMIDIISNSIVYLRPHGAQYSKQVRIPNTPRDETAIKMIVMWLVDMDQRSVSNTLIYGKNMEACFRHENIYLTIWTYFQIYKFVIILSSFSIYISQFWRLIWEFWAYILQRLKSKGWSL